MYKPQFPYLGNQAIITSGRVINHSYDDFIFLFGKKGVSVSSPATFTVDANERTIIASPKVELGFSAETRGEPVLLGTSTVTQLSRLLDDIKSLSEALKTLNPEQPNIAIPGIITAAVKLSASADSIKGLLSTECLSKNTYTR